MLGDSRQDADVAQGGAVFVGEFFAASLLSSSGEGGGGVGEKGVAGGAPAGAGVAEQADGEGGFLAGVVGGPNYAGVLRFGAAVGDAGVAQVLEGGRVVAGLVRKCPPKPSMCAQRRSPA